MQPRRLHAPPIRLGHPRTAAAADPALPRPPADLCGIAIGSLTTGLREWQPAVVERVASLATSMLSPIKGE